MAETTNNALDNIKIGLGFYIPESTRKFLEEEDKLPLEVRMQRKIRLCKKYGISSLQAIRFDENDKPIRNLFISANSMSF